MEGSIRAAVFEAMTAFHAKTGMCPHSIDIWLVDVTTIDAREKQFAVGEVRGRATVTPTHDAAGPAESH